jgi:transposase
VEPHCLGRPTDPGRSGSDNRRFVEAVLWIVRTGSPWRDLPPLFRNWNTIFKRYSDWVKADVFAGLFRGLLRHARHGIRHRRRHHRQGPSARTRCKRGSQSQAIGRSKGGMTTKILVLTDALGFPVRFVLMHGHRFDTVGVAPLIDGLGFDGFIADKAFYNNSIIADLNEHGAKIVISQHPRRVSPLPIDAEIY